MVEVVVVAEVVVEVVVVVAAIRFHYGSTFLLAHL